ncbi:hypothetical protein [Delftia sp. PE138]|uniref:hypothetical protein n=1 Tax=Delftia sp. PE138 TaxID=1812483 RepID=UPI001BB04205|nr:hypothetical protein [Delftia sp. PE138]MBS3721826.1 hypothetical protein [Delftia sp. PE138]
MTDHDSKLPSTAYFEERDALALLVPRAKVLAALADAYAPEGAAVPVSHPVDIAINHYPEALAMHSPLAQPVLYVSPEQLAEHSDDGPEHGRYLPARKTPAGKFTQPLYAGAPWLQGRYPHLPQSVGDVTDFGEGKVDIDWGHPAPAGGTRLYSAEQMRAYVDADRAARAEQHAAVAGPAWDKTRDSLATLLLGLARRPFLDFDVACIALDAATEPGMPLAYMRGAPAAPALEAPAAPPVPVDEFRGDTPSLVRNIVALLQLDADGALVPHGVGGHARGLLSAAAARLAAAPQAPAAPLIDGEGCLSDELRELITGMTVSVDVSTGEHDAGNRLFGEVTEVMEYDGGSDKHKVVLLVQSPEANFKAAPAAPAVDAREPIKPQQPQGMTSVNARLSFNHGWTAAERAHGIRQAAQAKEGGEAC